MDLTLLKNEAQRNHVSAEEMQTKINDSAVTSSQEAYVAPVVFGNPRVYCALLP
jgi:hypothetical protein